MFAFFSLVNNTYCAVCSKLNWTNLLEEWQKCDYNSSGFRAFNDTLIPERGTMWSYLQVYSKKNDLYVSFQACKFF